LRPNRLLIWSPVRSGWAVAEACAAIVGGGGLARLSVPNPDTSCHLHVLVHREDRDVLDCTGPGQQGQPAQHADEHQVDESDGHNE